MSWICKSDVSASLTTARDASANSMSALETKVGDSAAAINAEYARVATAHSEVDSAAVSEVVLAQEMASWQATHDDVTAEIDRLKAAN